jgi:hypothetical protein
MPVKGLDLPGGALTGNPATAKFVATPVVVGQTYHVVGVLDGDPNGFAGQLRLYVNGQSVGSIGGIGQLYKHANNPPDLRTGRLPAARWSEPDSGQQRLFGWRYRRVRDSACRSLAQPGRPALPILPNAPLPAEELSLRRLPSLPRGGFVTLSWSGGGQLQRAADLNGPFSVIAGAVSPYSSPINGSAAFYRVVLP